MNIVILNDYAHVNGGAGQVAISSAMALAQKGYNVKLFTAVGPVDVALQGEKNLEVICLQQFDILNDPNRLRAIINGFWNIKAARELKKILLGLDKKNTIVHVHACSKALTTSCIRMAITFDYKIIYHLHDYGVVCPNLGFYNYQERRICEYNPLHYKCLLKNCDSRTYLHKIWRCLRQYVQHSWGRLPSGIKNFIVVSNFSHQILKKYLPLNNETQLVKNPINISKSSLNRGSSNKNIIFIGRLTPEKNPVLLAKVANELKIPVTFIGEGMCAKEILEVYPQAIITGWLNFQEVQGYLRKARALVLTSLWYETQGLVVAEAAACGVPSIVPDTCAARDFIIDGKTGLIFKSGDEDDLRQKLLMMQNDVIAQNMGKAAYDCYWEEPMDMDRYVSEITAIYTQILQ